MYSTRSLSATFGAEVLDFQLTGEPDGADIVAIRELWSEHKLLLFRNQSFDEAALVGFSRKFGDLEIHVREEYLSPEHPEILYVSNIERDGKRIGILSDNEVGWHYDQIYLPKPAVGSLLMADTLPPEEAIPNSQICVRPGMLCRRRHVTGWTAPSPTKAMRRSIKPIAFRPILSRRRGRLTFITPLPGHTPSLAGRHSTFARE